MSNHPSKEHDFVAGIALGAILVFMGMVLLGFTYSEFCDGQCVIFTEHSEDLDAPDNLFDQYQTFLAGLLGLGGGWLAYLAGMKQVRENRRVEFDRLKRQETYARAMLPHTLSQICLFCTATTDSYVQLLNALGESADAKQSFFVKRPDIDPEVIENLRECARDGSQDLRIATVWLIKMLQVSYVRADVLQQQRGRDIRNIHDSLLNQISDCIRLYAGASELFDYARWTSETVPSGISDETKNNVWISFWDRLHPKLERETYEELVKVLEQQISDHEGYQERIY